MSLFPAYSGQTVVPKTEKPDNDWLDNNSYPAPHSFPEAGKVARSSSVSRHSPNARRKKKKNKKKHNRSSTPSCSETTKQGAKRKKHKRSPTPSHSETAKRKKIEDTVIFDKGEKFCIHKERTEAFLSIKTIPKSLRPRYKKNIFPGLFPFHERKSKVKLHRYFRNTGSMHEADEGSLENETEASKRTVEDFNRKLLNNPHDIPVWIEFVNFQDEFYKYQHIQFKSDVERERAANQRKLSILDKAVEKNPDSKELQMLWLEIGTTVMSSEKLSKRIDQILEQSGGTMVLWLGLMTTTQYSLSRCTLPSVSLLFEKLLMNFQNVKSDLYTRDKNVLELLFHYERFLDNCGQWETLWTILKVNLQFNTKILLDFDIEVDTKVKGLEDKIMREEKRAIWQLWSQLERIREGLHFLPSNTSVDYPQRCVEPGNVVNFTWHFLPELHFQLVISSLVVMKVPLLPSSQTIFKLLTPNALPWIYDSPEYILSSLLSSPAVKLQNQYLSPLSQLSRGPQYLRALHGQKEFLDFISLTFESCLKGLEGKQKIALGMWWLRFERWIHLLNELKLASLPESRKTAKKFFKEFLANAENRENLLYYMEYCLLQFNQGNTDECIKALKTLISSRLPVLKLNLLEERGPLTAVYKCLCEVFLATNQRENATNLLINLGNGAAIDTTVTIQSLLSAEKKFKELSFQLIDELDSSSDWAVEDFLIPNFITEWISCYLWLIALTKTSLVLRSTYNEIFTQLTNKNGLVPEQIRECLWETILAITWTFERNNLLLVRDTLQKSYSNYPKNLKILSYMADNSLEDSRLWLSIRKTFLSPPSTMSCIYLICVALHRYQKDKDTYHNRMKNMFSDLALKNGKVSSIIHCLRLRYLYENQDAYLEKAQLQALESCPWCKSIYMESILLLPAKLMQLTDVLIEKELKIHITPDEIQEMRD